MQRMLEGLAARLEICVTRMGGKRALASASGVSEAQLYRYMGNAKAVPVERLLSIATAAGVDAGWLLTGKGSIDGMVSAAEKRPPFRPALLTEVTQVFEELLVEYGKPFTPQQRARAITLMYEAMRTEELRRGEEMVLEKGFALNFVDFLQELNVGGDLEMYPQLMARMVYDQDELTPQQALQFDRMVTAGNRATFEKLSGQHYFERMGQSLANEAAQRLLSWVEMAQKQLAKQQVRWLDLGCGNGRHLAFLQRNCPNVDYEGVDSSSLAMKLCGELERAGKLAKGSVQQADFRHLPFTENQMDVVFCRMGLYSAPWLKAHEVGANLMMREVKRVLRPGGLFYVISLLDDGRTYLPFYQYYTRERFRELAGINGFEVIDFKENSTPSDNAGVRGVDYAGFFRDSFEAVLRAKP